jgi:hypothetical protein
MRCWIPESLATEGFRNYFWLKIEGREARRRGRGMTRRTACLPGGDEIADDRRAEVEGVVRDFVFAICDLRTIQISGGSVQPAC